MLKYSDIKGLSVVSVVNGSLIGFVESLAFRHRDPIVTSFIIDSADNKKLELNESNIIGFGSDAIITDIVPGQAVEYVELGEDIINADDFGDVVVTLDGQIVGKLSAILIDESDKRIVQLQLAESSNGLVVKGQDIVCLGKDFIIVNANYKAVDAKVEQQAAPVDTAAKLSEDEKQFRERIDSYKQHVLEQSAKDELESAAKAEEEVNESVDEQPEMMVQSTAGVMTSQLSNIDDDQPAIHQNGVFKPEEMDARLQDVELSDETVSSETLSQSAFSQDSLSQQNFANEELDKAELVDKLFAKEALAKEAAIQEAKVEKEVTFEDERVNSFYQKNKGREISKNIPDYNGNLIVKSGDIVDEKFVVSVLNYNPQLFDVIEWFLV